MIRATVRAVTRPIKRLALPLRLRWIDFQRVRSGREVERLTEMNEDINRLMRTEHFHQVQLEVRRNEIMRGAW